MQWTRLCTHLSEWSGYFFSDTIISNETSYLEPVTALQQVPKGLGYIGVGPEQNFTYLAVLEPSLAFVVDIRRDNWLLHLLYKALFELAPTRGQWLAMLLGRPSQQVRASDEHATLPDLLSRLEAVMPSEAVYRQVHDRLMRRIGAWAITRPVTDGRRLEALHRRFFMEQLEITFQLRKPSDKTYPSLRSLLLARGPGGGMLGFLAGADSYHRVRRLQLDNRIVPVVGDFTGHHALVGIALELHRRGLALGALYASNVEQYVFEERRWNRWIDNCLRLPFAQQAVIIRSYVDQGRCHPLQRPEHRITTLAQGAPGFVHRQKQRGYRGYWELVTDASTTMTDIALDNYG